METEHPDVTGNAQSPLKHYRDTTKLMSDEPSFTPCAFAGYTVLSLFFSSVGDCGEMWLSLISRMATKSLLCARCAVQLEAQLRGATRAQTFQISVLCDVQSSILGEQSCIS